MATPRTDIIQRVSMVDNVTERLRHDLLSGEIRPGEKIRVAVLEKRFGVSHIPIREAFRRLESEGLIVAAPQRAVVAAGVDLEDLGALYDLRRIIECTVIERSAAEMSDEQTETVRARLAELEATSSDVDSPGFWEAHRAFHWALLEPAASPWVERVLDQIWTASERYVRLYVSETVAGAMRDHRELLRDCELHDGAAAAELLRRHLYRTEQTVRAAFVPTRADHESEE